MPNDTMKPPFRADQVGSLLRPKRLSDARNEWRQGNLDADAIRVSDDRRTIRLTLPDPVLSDADVQESSTKIVSRDRGIVDRLGDVLEEAVRQLSHR